MIKISSVASRQRGKFITFEGGDGVGKTTQMEGLATYLRQRGIDLITTREPGGTAVGEKLRAVLLNSRTTGLSPLAELGLMFADRAQHIDEMILPALARGQWVLCDRFTDSSEAYQGGGRQLGTKVVLQLHKLLCRDLQPDLTILMMSNVGSSLARARKRNMEKSKGKQADEDRFEKEIKAFHKRVSDAYLKIAEREQQRVAKVDARQPQDKVHRRIVELVEARLRLPPE
ncbi:MAG TPA: dTMP kinase [Candidatus Saccharimonadales bacterium]|nr:dTMP kinase [Candidatus Saccharimonadales bacterium]